MGLCILSLSKTHASCHSSRFLLAEPAPCELPLLARFPNCAFFMHIGWCWWGIHMMLSMTQLLLRYFRYRIRVTRLVGGRQLLGSGVHGSGACSVTLWRGCERITVPSHFCYVITSCGIEGSAGEDVASTTHQVTSNRADASL